MAFIFRKEVVDTSILDNLLLVAYNSDGFKMYVATYFYLYDTETEKLLEFETTDRTVTLDKQTFDSLISFYKAMA